MTKQNKYRFLHDNHVHQIFKDGEWKNLYGTSGVPGILNKNGLTWWASGLAVGKLGWLSKKDGSKFLRKEDRIKAAEKKLSEIKGMSAEDYLNLLDDAYCAHSKKLDSSASAGTDLHALAEAWIKAQISGNLITPHPQIMPLVKWAEENVQTWLWSEMHCYSEVDWLGGISDAGFIDKDGRFAILDIKSSKEAYTSQFIQCAGYDKQITENGGYTSDGKKIYDLGTNKIDYYVIFPFGMTEPTAQTRHNTEDLKEAFDACLKLFKFLN